MASPADDPASVQQARARARRRLIGAVVLLAIGVIVFPVLFETKPRALPPDIPIHVSRRDSGTVITTPAATAPVRPAPTADAGIESAAEAPRAAASTPPQASAPAAARPAASVAAAAASAGESKAGPTPRAEARTADVKSAEPKVAEPKAADTKAADTKAADTKAADAKAADAKPAADTASAPKSGRYVVQVGAFTDPLAVREARQKVEKLGLKTYTQEVDTPTGRRIRVRVGPFDTKADADQAGARLKAAGLPVYLLLL